MSIYIGGIIDKISVIYKKILLSFYKLSIVNLIFMCYNTSERKEGTVQWEIKNLLKKKRKVRSNEYLKKDLNTKTKAEGLIKKEKQR
jgi:hypothetical protein